MAMLSSFFICDILVSAAIFFDSSALQHAPLSSHLFLILQLYSLTFSAAIFLILAAPFNLTLSVDKSLSIHISVHISLIVISIQFMN